MNYVRQRPLVLAFSGGSDSTALLFACLEHREKLALDLHLAHVDHGWRDESYEEALALKRLSIDLGLPFHLKRLDPPPKTKDLENYARNQRYKFFYELVTEIDAQAILLAHHASDQAEVILKRVFEGSHLLALSGMKEVSKHTTIPLWRPLLNIDKDLIKRYLEKKSLSWYEDKTNHEGGFLRTKMRVKILPSLEENFGKNPLIPLRRLAEQTSMLQEHFEEEFSSVISNMGNDRICLKKFKLSKLFSFLLLKKLCEHWEIFASYEETLRGAESLMGVKKEFVIRSKKMQIILKKEAILFNQLELNRK